jgi:hypothetical protein
MLIATFSILHKSKKLSWVLVAHTHHPSYSAGRDQEDQKNPSQKRAGGMTQGVGPEFKPQYHQTASPQTMK